MAVVASFRAFLDSGWHATNRQGGVVFKLTPTDEDEAREAWADLAKRGQKLELTVTVEGEPLEAGSVPDEVLEG